MKRLFTLLSLPIAMLAIGCDDKPDNRNTSNVTPTHVEPDNTEVNKRDADGHTATAFDQSNDKADIELVAKIRKQVVDVDKMSVKGQNVKIITNAGKVILRGPVDTAAEKDSIGKIAVDAAGAGNVTNNLEVETH